jgi:hypothetical protein
VQATARWSREMKEQCAAHSAAVPGSITFLHQYRKQLRQGGHTFQCYIRNLRASAEALLAERDRRESKWMPDAPSSAPMCYNDGSDDETDDYSQ